MIAAMYTHNNKSFLYRASVLFDLNGLQSTTIT